MCACMCVRICMCVCARACVRPCVCVCVGAQYRFSIQLRIPQLQCRSFMPADAGQVDTPADTPTSFWLLWLLLSSSSCDEVISTDGVRSSIARLHHEGLNTCHHKIITSTTDTVTLAWHEMWSYHVIAQVYNCTCKPIPWDRASWHPSDLAKWQIMWELSSTESLPPTETWHMVGWWIH